MILQADSVLFARKTPDVTQKADYRSIRGERAGKRMAAHHRLLGAKLNAKE